jgi:integrase
MLSPSNLNGDEEMKTEEFGKTAEALYAKMRKDGYSKMCLDTATWMVSYFEKYCHEKSIEDVTPQVAAMFLRERFDFDYYHPIATMQIVIRRPLLILLEFYESGTYCKTHQVNSSEIAIPVAFEGVFLKYRAFVNGMGICMQSKKRKLWGISIFLAFLASKNVHKIESMRFDDAPMFINSLTTYSASTKRTIASTLRESLDWMFTQDMIKFPGRKAFPLIRNASRRNIISWYSRDEIAQLLAAIDTETIRGKADFFVISALAFWGLRAGDLARLKFSEIDWANSTVRIIQQKTGKFVTLPLIEEVKFPLLDYLKNCRCKSADDEYVLVTRYAPHTRVETGSINRTVNKCMKAANISVEGKHHGPHALRHSLATNLMSENVPISAISSILGHSSTKTTELYITVDETNLKELALEVDDVM